MRVAVHGRAGRLRRGGLPGGRAAVPLLQPGGARGRIPNGRGAVGGGELVPASR